MEREAGTAPAGWYPDPAGSGRRRWWDGTDWAEPGWAEPGWEGRNEEPPAPAPGPPGLDGPDGHVLTEDPPARKGRGSGRVLLVGGAVVVSLFAAGVFVTGAMRGFAPDSMATPSPSAVKTDPPKALPPVWPPRAAGQTKASYYGPTPGHEERIWPLGSPAPLAAASDSYAFFPSGMAGQKFVAYDPCRPIHYVVRAANAPAGGLELIQAGFAELSRVTGLTFVYDGPTQEAPSEKRKAYQPQLYGDRWAPVLVAWTSPEEYPPMASYNRAEGRVPLGMAGSHPAARGPAGRVYVTGHVSLNAQALAEVAAREGQPTVYSSVIAHELAHLAGEDHVQDTSQLMYPVRDKHVTGYAAGDLTGLAQLGEGPCAPDL